MSDKHYTVTHEGRIEVDARKLFRLPHVQKAMKTLSNLEPAVDPRQATAREILAMVESHIARSRENAVEFHRLMAPLSAMQAESHGIMAEMIAAEIRRTYGIKEGE